jgi:spore germination protein YaaH
MRTPARLWLRAGLLGAALALLSAGCSWGPTAAPKPAPKKPPRQTGSTANSPTTPSGLKVIAFYDYQAGTAAPPNPLSLLKAHPGLVTDIAPFWYKVAADGSISTRPQGNVAALVAQLHAGLMPLFDNAGGTDAFLHTAQLRTTVVNNIVGLVTHQHYAGVNIDFQGLMPSDRQDLTLFMDQLSRAMPSNTLLSMSVVPLTNLNGASSAYDYAALNRVVGAMVLMAYDLHGDGTAPGPVSPIAWVSRSIRLAIKAGITPGKLYLGIADYGYDWPAGSTKAATVPLKVMHAYRYGRYVWVPQYAEGKAVYTSGGVTHTIWFVPDRGAVARIQLAKRYHLVGVAFWRIGYEDAKWWNAVARAIGGPATGAARRRAGRRMPGHGASKAGLRVRPAPRGAPRKAGITRKPHPRRSPQHRGRPA